MSAHIRTTSKTRTKVVPFRVEAMTRGRTASRVSPARDRTVKRLLYELVRLGERTGRRDFVKLTMRLHSVLAEMGHDV